MGRRTKDAVLRSGAGRFHADPGKEPTSYVADSLETAWLEIKAHAGEARVNVRAFHAWRVVLRQRPDQGFVDLRIHEERERYRITQAELEADPAPESLKELARRLRMEGKAGVVYRSVRNRPDGVCLALFLEHVKDELAVEPAKEEWEGFIQRISSIDTGREGER